MPERPRLHKFVFKPLKRYILTAECSAVMNDKLKKALGFLTNTLTLYIQYTFVLSTRKFPNRNKVKRSLCMKYTCPRKLPLKCNLSLQKNNKNNISGILKCIKFGKKIYCLGLLPLTVYWSLEKLSFCVCTEATEKNIH